MPFFNPDITPEMTEVLARRAWFSMNVNRHDATGLDGYNGADWRLAGEGVDTLDQAIRILESGPVGSFYPSIEPTIELDYGAIISDMRQVGLENLQELRTAYIAVYGTVNRPDVYSSPRIL